MENALFEQLPFQENAFYETIISDLVEKNYAVVNRFFSAEEVSILRACLVEKYEEDRFKKAAIGNKTNELVEKSIRGDFILWMNEAEKGPAEAIFFNKINALVEYLNATCFLGILNKEFHYAVYPRGTFYKRHLDTFQNDGRRKLSLVCYLNEANWNPENGGELVLYPEEDGKEKNLPIFPLPGRLVLFESRFLEHEVKPVLSGSRFSITGWLKTR